MVSRAGWCNVEPRTAYPYLRSIFTAAGFAEVSRPTLRRAVMRIDF
jgi:hypothetical protein